MPKDYYSILGVSKDATPEEMKRAFRTLARESHPDANPDDPTAEARFREVAEAYEVLSDPEKRRAYDRGESLDFGDLFSGFGLDDLLRSVFGDSGLFGAAGRGGGRRRGRDILAQTTISLAEASFGATAEVQYRAAAACEVCSGSGAAEGSRPITCPQCNGQGAVQAARRTVLGTMMSVVECDRCHGVGTIVESPCPTCSGSGATVGDRSVRVEVPEGVADGTRLRLSGQGEAGQRGAPAGDLYVEIRVMPDERFERNGDDLIFRAEVGLAEAALGSSVEVPLLEGDSTTIEVPAGTQPNTMFSLPNKGMHRLGRRGRGRMLVEINLVVPTDLDDASEQALRQYAQARGESVEAPRRWRKAR